MLAAAAGLPGAGAAGFLTFVLGPDGLVYSWTAGDPRLSPLPPSLAHLAGRPVNDLVMSAEGGRTVFLPAASRRAGGHRPRIAGSAVVVSTPTTAAPPAILNEIPFEGDGRRVAVSPDGRFACVLAILAGPDATGDEARARLYALDLEEGGVLSSARLDIPPSDIALDPSGTRLYLGYAGRIQTYTTRPLARSWHYRSPGPNRGLCFRPDSAVLCSVRRDQVALFDPEVIAARKTGERQKLLDDATAVIQLKVSAGALLFSRDGSLAVASGPGNVLAFFAPGTGGVVTTTVDVDGPVTPREVRPFYFAEPPGDVAVAIYPDKLVRSVTPPGSLVHPANEKNDTESIEARRIPSSESPAPTPSPLPIPVASSTPSPTPSPAPAQTPLAANPPPDIPPMLAGRLTGRIEAVRAIVIYGPGSIVREQGRVVPDADGGWRMPLPAPGSYRIVPVGEGSRPVLSEPNFQTLEVKSLGVTGVDFKILGAS